MAATAAPRPHQPLYPACAPGEQQGIPAAMSGSGWALASPFWDHLGLKQVGGQQGRVSAAGGRGSCSHGLGCDDDVAVALDPCQLVTLKVHHQLLQP